MADAKIASESPRAANQRRAAQVQSGAARAAMLGVSDGLITNIALILGVASSGAAPGFVRLAGVASLVAGAISMAIGEYISMQAQRELLQSILTLEREALRDDPEQARASLAEILTEQGVNPEHAKVAAHDLARDPEKATMVYAQNRLGIDPDELGSAWSAAASSLVTFAGGALVPLMPWFFLTGSAAILASVIAAGLAALAVGSYLGYMTGAPWYRVAARQLALVALAAVITYGVGLLFHVNVA